VDQLLEKETVGEKAFREATGLGSKWLIQFEEWEIITFKRAGDEKIYSQDDVIIGKLMVDLDRAVLDPKTDSTPKTSNVMWIFFAKSLSWRTPNIYRPVWKSSLPSRTLNGWSKGESS
jgi:hypothetical protein